MADPTKIPDKPDPDNVRGRSIVEPNHGHPVIGSRRNYPWAWIIAVIIVLLIIWAFFSWYHRALVVSPDTAPAPTTSTTIR